MADPIRIANCSGFFGDRQSAATEMVTDGPLDVLTGDWLAELTMLILSRTRDRSGGGYANTFVRMLEEVLGVCLDRGIKIVSNAGGLDPAGCAQAVEKLAQELGLSPKIAYVDGDDLSARTAELLAAGDLRPQPPQTNLGDPADFLTVHAYGGGWGITEALLSGAEVVITGRVTDAALVSGPAAAHHGWSRTDWDQLAGAVVAGHIIECSGQATGGNYSFFTEIPHLDDWSGGARVGFPWAEVAEDGSAVIGKHAQTGGAVTHGTVTAQLLYEIGSPAYLGPDVVARFDTIELEGIAPDRVRVSGVKGEPPPTTLKVIINRPGGYRNGFEMAITGLDIEAKARFAQAAFWNVCPYQPEDFQLVRSELHRTDHPDPATNEQATAIWRLVCLDPDQHKVGRVLTNAAVQTALSSIPGLYLRGGSPTSATPYAVMSTTTVPAKRVPQYVHLQDGSSKQVPAEPPSYEGGSITPYQQPEVPELIYRPTQTLPLGTLVGARSGDKGGDANLGLFARSEAVWDWLWSFLTTEQLRHLLPEVSPLEIERYGLANLWSINFVIRGLLEEGVAACTRLDPQAKSLGEWLRARSVPIPTELLREDGRA